MVEMVMTGRANPKAGQGCPRSGWLDCSFRYHILNNHQAKIDGCKEHGGLNLQTATVSVNSTHCPCWMNQQHDSRNWQGESKTPPPHSVVGESKRNDTTSCRTKVSDRDGLQNRSHRSRPATRQNDERGIHGARSCSLTLIVRWPVVYHRRKFSHPFIHNSFTHSLCLPGYRTAGSFITRVKRQGFPTPVGPAECEKSSRDNAKLFCPLRPNSRVVSLHLRAVLDHFSISA